MRCTSISTTHIVGLRMNASWEIEVEEIMGKVNCETGLVELRLCLCLCSSSPYSVQKEKKRKKKKRWEGGAMKKVQCNNARKCEY